MSTVALFIVTLALGVLAIATGVQLSKPGEPITGALLAVIFVVEVTALCAAAMLLLLAPMWR